MGRIRTCVDGLWDRAGTSPVYPAILKLTFIISYHTLWWTKGSEHNPHITNHFPEIICANAATALRLLPFTFSVLGDISAFLKFRKCFSHTQKTLSFLSISSLETTYSTSESHPNETRTRISSVKGWYPRPVRRWGVKAVFYGTATRRKEVFKIYRSRVTLEWFEHSLSGWEPDLLSR